MFLKPHWRWVRVDGGPEQLAPISCLFSTPFASFWSLYITGSNSSFCSICRNKEFLCIWHQDTLPTPNQIRPKASITLLPAPAESWMRTSPRQPFGWRANDPCVKPACPNWGSQLPSESPCSHVWAAAGSDGSNLQPGLAQRSPLGSPRERQTVLSFSC